MRGVLLALLAAIDPSLAPDPSVYWVSTPTLANETIMVAGAFPESVSAKLCTAKDCSGGSAVPTPPLTSWAHSVKLVLPEKCGPPCYLSLSGSADDARNGSSSKSSATLVQVNGPDVWWALSGSPSKGVGAADRDYISNKPLQVAVQLGDTIRAFGRALAWSADNAACLSAADAPAAVPTTRLALGSATGQAVGSTHNLLLRVSYGSS